MKIAFHDFVKGKPEQTKINDKVYVLQQDGHTVNLGYGWFNVDLPYKDIFELITVDGLATSSELKNDHRADINFVSRQLFMVDIDNGMTIQELFNNDFYNEFGCGFYTTKRHTDDNHRFRIMFMTEEPITDVNTCKKIIRGLLTMFESADTSCKDASRIYYGTVNCQIKECREKYLPKYITDELVKLIDSLDNNKQSNYVPTTYDNKQTIPVDMVNELLYLISQKTGNLRGEYEQWRTIAWATCHTVGMNDAHNLMMRYWPDKTKKEIKTLTSWKHKSDSPTVGTLIKLSGINKKDLYELNVKYGLREKKKIKGISEDVYNFNME